MATITALLSFFLDWRIVSTQSINKFEQIGNKSITTIITIQGYITQTAIKIIKSRIVTSAVIVRAGYYNYCSFESACTICHLRRMLSKIYKPYSIVSAR